MQEDMKLVDLLIELVDARAPLSSRNPDIDQLGKQKARLILLNKADLADAKGNERWTAWFQAQGFHVLQVSAREGTGLKAINSAVASACQEKLERDRRRGIQNRPVRAMVAGIPNVGKSTFINSFAGRAAAKTGNKPGVTRGNQWIRLNKSLELLDTPGILWPKFEDQTAGLRLALLGSVKDDILNTSELAAELVKALKKDYPQAIPARYGFEQPNDPYQTLEEVARVRKCMQKGGVYDTEKAAAMLLDDFRSGKLGRITLEMPGEKEGAE